jgi:hypothetical protein
VGEPSGSLFHLFIARPAKRISRLILSDPSTTPPNLTKR